MATFLELTCWKSYYWDRGKLLKTMNSLIQAIHSQWCIMSGNFRLPILWLFQFSFLKNLLKKSAFFKYLISFWAFALLIWIRFLGLAGFCLTILLFRYSLNCIWYTYDNLYLLYFKMKFGFLFFFNVQNAAMYTC